MQAEQRGAHHLVSHCADVRAEERVLVVCERATRPLAQAIVGAAQLAGAGAEPVEIPALRIHGEEPPPVVARAMRAVDVVFGLTRMSMAHTEARRRASLTGTRYLSLPDYDRTLLAGRALRADFRGLSQIAHGLAATFTAGRSIRLTSRAGTDLTLDIRGRSGNAAPGWCEGPGTLASPPDAEANVAPLEDSAEGVLVVDGSVPCAELGLLATPLTLHLRRGYVHRVEGEAAPLFERVIGRVGDLAGRIVAELGVGLNPQARIVGSMLEDEGALGAVHIGIGANTALGGENRVPFHLDHVLRAPTLRVDDRTLIRDGRLLV